MLFRCANIISLRRGRARAEVQGRGDDGAGSEEGIGDPPSGGGDNVAIRGRCFLRKQNHPFFGEASEERRPWTSNAKTPGRFCPASSWISSEHFA